MDHSTHGILGSKVENMDGVNGKRFLQKALARSAAAVLGVCALLAATAVGAQPRETYGCKSETGRLITTDRIGDCHGKETRVIGPDGRTVRTIPAPLTQEQKDVIAAAARQKKEEEIKRRELRRVDDALLDTFRDADDLEVKRARALDQIKQDLAGSQGRMERMKKLHAEYLQEAEFYKKKALPPDLKRKIDDNEAAMKGEQNTMTSKQNEVVQVNARFDSDKKRLLELTEASKPGSTSAASTATAAKDPGKAAPKKN